MEKQRWDVSGVNEERVYNLLNDVLKELDTRPAYKPPARVIIRVIHKINYT